MAIHNCSAILTDPAGRYRLTPAAARRAFADLTIYTNAESCAMCAAAIRWAGFGAYVFGTGIDALADGGWPQIRIASADVFAASGGLGPPTRLISGVLVEETDPMFGWQFDRAGACPPGCRRVGGTCRAVE